MQCEPSLGDCVVVTRNTGQHGGQVGQQFIVCHVDDSDDTLRGMPRGSAQVADYWIPWSDVEPVTFGWDYARGHLPAEVVRLLKACDGVEHLNLNPRIKELVFDSLPDWRERVLEVLDSLEADDA